MSFIDGDEPWLADIPDSSLDTDGESSPLVLVFLGAIVFVVIALLVIGTLKAVHEYNNERNCAIAHGEWNDEWKFCE